MKTAILTVSFGTSYNDSREKTIGAIEQALAKAYPEYEVRRAFTSGMILRKLKERDGIEIDNVAQALERAAADGIRTLIVAPTHMMAGFEYQDVVKEVEAYRNRFEKVYLSAPLLDSDADYDAVIAAIVGRTAAYDDQKTAICFMGHGTEADSNRVYAALQEKIRAKGYANYYIGTVEAAPSIEDVVKLLSEKEIYRRAVLEPLMVVAGDHANNDMAGEEDDSWKSILEKKGYEVICILEGLGELPAIQKIYVDHVKAALRSER